VNRQRRNIEFKARCNDLAAAREAALRLGARSAGVLHQVDTYFHTRQGRLKLRQILPDRAELISYDRPDNADARASDYRVLPVADPEAMLAILSETLGVRQRVEKARDLLLWENVRIHLDDVADLGRFIEFEAVIQHGDDELASYQRLATLAEHLQVNLDDRIATSYGDLVAQA
jgi:predicted adenylyl cyclase CyaB